jgi:hypothetical protein
VRCRGRGRVLAVAAVLATAGCVGGDATVGPAQSADIRVATYLEDDMTEIPLRVTEKACASGRSAEGRIEVLEATLTDSELRLDVGVVPFAGDQQCPGNPETPYTLVLDEPLGPRDVVDANSQPNRPILLGTRRRVP